MHLEEEKFDQNHFKSYRFVYSSFEKSTLTFYKNSQSEWISLHCGALRSRSRHSIDPFFAAVIMFIHPCYWVIQLPSPPPPFTLPCAPMPFSVSIMALWFFSAMLTTPSCIFLDIWAPISCPAACNFFILWLHS